MTQVYLSITRRGEESNMRENLTSCTWSLPSRFALLVTADFCDWEVLLVRLIYVAYDADTVYPGQESRHTHTQHTQQNGCPHIEAEVQRLQLQCGLQKHCSFKSTSSRQRNTPSTLSQMRWTHSLLSLRHSHSHSLTLPDPNPFCPAAMGADTAAMSKPM